MSNHPLRLMLYRTRRKLMPYILRQWDRGIRRRPHKTPGSIRIFGWELEYVDAPALRSQLQHQVVERYNDFYCDKPAPLILDCGANIGISVLRFKQLFPLAKIIAFEPDASIVPVLRRNLRGNGAGDVEIIEAAVWKEHGTMRFFSKASDAGHLLLEAAHEVTTPIHIVKTVPLADYLQAPVDFVKLDVEGAELDVLEACADRLFNVQKMVVEIHYYAARPGILASILQILNDVNFNVTLRTRRYIDLLEPYHSKFPTDYDQLPVIYAWRSV